jgi:CheY-like chemotaxis protein
MPPTPAAPPRSRATELGVLVDTVLTSAAHEFKTSLAVVRGHAQLLRRRCCANDASVATITRQVDRLTHLVQQCIEFLRLRTAPAAIPPTSFDLCRVVENAVERARLSAPGREVSFVPSPTRPVQGDPDRIEHAISNILDNALRYSPAESAVEVTLAEHQDEVRVSVRDRGAGFPGALRDRLCDPGMASMRPPRMAPGGLGLGLCVCDHIIRSHGGRLTLSRNDDAGSTFALSLPCSPHFTLRQRGTQVLVVEDDPDLLEILEYVLLQSGFHVRTAKNGAEALRCAAEELPGLIFLDMQMPTMDGWAFAREFRVRYGRVCPIVVMTAAESASARARDVAADAWLGKPFDLDEVARHAERFLPCAGVPADVARPAEPPSAPGARPQW